MIDMDQCMSLAKKVEFSSGSDEPGIRHGDARGDMTTVHGYDKNGKLLFFAKYNKSGEFRLSLYSEGNKEDLYSDELDDISLSLFQKKRLADAGKFINKLKTRQSRGEPEKRSLAELMKKGIDVKLTEQSRLSFAPDIDNLRISKDEEGVLHMAGVSKDGKQQIDFSARDGVMQFELCNNDLARSYNNKIGGKWTWRDLKSSSGTYYLDNQGETYAKEMAEIMNKVKAQYQVRLQSNAYVNNELKDKSR